MINKVKVGYRTFDLHMIDPELPAKYSDSVGETHRSSRKRGRIFVDKVEDKVEEVNTLVHEVFHAIWQVFCLAEGDEEERIVTTMANGFTSVLVDNPAILKYLGDLHLEVTEATINDSNDHRRGVDGNVQEVQVKDKRRPK